MPLNRTKELSEGLMQLTVSGYGRFAMYRITTETAVEQA